MGLYENILVPVMLEGTPREKQAIDVAKALCSKGGKITLLHVVEEIPAYYAYPVLDQAISESVEQVKKDLSELAAANGIKNATMVAKGHASRTILDIANDNGSDCIIIASHKPGLEDYLLGSTAARVVRHAKCPVHVLR